MINSIILKNLRNSEFIQFNKNIANLIQQKDPELLKVEQLYSTYATRIEELENLFKTPTGSPITTEMEELDFRRDEAITGITAIIMGSTHHYDPDMKAAAVLLQNNLNLYSAGIQKENYQSETAIINNLVNDWRNKPELQNAIDMLGILEWSMELKEINDLFDEKYMNRAQTYAAAPIDNQRSKRLEVMNTYYELRKCVEVFALITPSALYDSLMGEANQIINMYIPLTKSKKKQADPQEN